MKSASAGVCWLWEDINCHDTSENHWDIAQSFSPFVDTKLWFETVVSREICVENEGIEIGTSEGCEVLTLKDAIGSSFDAANARSATDFDENSLKETLAVSALQRWWRLKCEQRKSVRTVTDCNEIRLKETLAVSALQRWWRLKCEHMKIADVVMYDYFDDNADCDDETDSEMDSRNIRLSCHIDQDVQYNLETKSVVESGVVVKTNRSETTPPAEFKYGTFDDEIRMRHWLDEQRLPQGVADAFLSIGVRTIDDICFVVSEDEDVDIMDFMSQFTVLDRRKLVKAVKSISSTPPSLLLDTEMIDSNLNWLEEME
jgi:hypothetical protein